ncbi:MAG: bifunctional metallophosphatase/5'-nucleotidase, partial [Fimbriimonadaceae bacterium]
GQEYGGYARLATLIQQRRAVDENPLLLDAGDVFQGTIYFNVYEGLADLAFMNYVGYQAMAVGNHEFDRGPEPLRVFAELAEFPLLAANLDLSGDPALDAVVEPYTVVEVDGEPIGIVGNITESIFAISSPGDTVALADQVESIQASIDELQADGVDKIILLSHQGFGQDLNLVEQLEGVDLAIGGHSHTLLGNFDGHPFSGRGNYPTMVTDAAGREVPVVQAWQWGALLGRIVLEFDENGEVSEILEAQPIPVDESIEPDPVVETMVAGWMLPVADMVNQVLSIAPVDIPRGPRSQLENPVGNILADAYLAAAQNAEAVVAFTNVGGVRADIEAGDVTYGDLLTVAPFNNTLVILEVTGEELLAALEHGAAGGGRLLPSAGTSYVVDLDADFGNRVSEVVIDGEPLDLDANYRIILNSFTAGGGDGHEVLRDAEGYRVDTGLLDIDALVEFVQQLETLEAEREGRIRPGN